MGYFQSQVETSSRAATGSLKDLRAPQADEFEITIIGQGVGESIVVHFGNGDWLIVDSFEIAGQAKSELLPAPAQYLSDIGVEVESAVVAICVTHPHSDHYGGIADLMQACTPEGGNPPWLYWPDPLHPDVWTRLREAPPGTPRSELRDVFDTAYKRPNTVRYLNHRRRLDPPLDAMQALSPLPGASEAINHQQRSNFYENLSSITMWFRMHGIAGLLGADLDDHADFGWRALVEERDKHGEPAIPPGFGVIKVPHHGSMTAGTPEAIEAIRSFAAFAHPVSVFTRNSSSDLPDSSVVDRYRPWSETITLGNPADVRAPVGWATFRATEYDNGWNLETFGAINIPENQAKGR